MVIEASGIGLAIQKASLFLRPRAVGAGLGPEAIFGNPLGRGTRSNKPRKLLLPLPAFGSHAAVSEKTELRRHEFEFSAGLCPRQVHSGCCPSEPQYNASGT